MPPETFAEQIRRALDASGDQSRAALDHLQGLARELEQAVQADGLHVQVEPGYMVNAGLQGRVVLAIPSRNYRDVLFRAYIPAGGYPLSLDLYGEELIPCADAQELREQVAAFLTRPDIVARLNALRDIASLPPT